MAGALVDAIGIGSAALTAIGFLQSNWAAHEAQGATVKLKAGLPSFDDEGDSLVRWLAITCHGKGSYNPVQTIGNDGFSGLRRPQFWHGLLSTVLLGYAVKADLVTGGLD